MVLTTEHLAHTHTHTLEFLKLFFSVSWLTMRDGPTQWSKEEVSFLVGSGVEGCCVVAQVHADARVIGANLTTKCPHEVTWKQIVSTFIKHSLQEINITKIFPPKLAYFFNQCIIVNQLAVFKQQYFFEDR